MYSYLKQVKMSFFFNKMKNRKTKQVLSGGLVPVGKRGVYKERVKELLPERNDVIQSWTGPSKTVSQTSLLSTS
jgi:hypothetical protein